MYLATSATLIQAKCEKKEAVSYNRKPERSHHKQQMNGTSETSNFHAALIAASTAFVLLAFLHLYMASASSKSSDEKAKKLVSLCFCSCAVETVHGLIVALKFVFVRSEEGWCKLIEPIGLSSAAVARSCAYWMLKHRIRYLNDSNDNFRFG